MTRNFEPFENKGAYSPARLIRGLFLAYSGHIEAYRPLPQGQNKPLNPPLRGLEAYCPEGVLRSASFPPDAPPGNGLSRLWATRVPALSINAITY